MNAINTFRSWPLALAALALALSFALSACDTEGDGGPGGDDDTCYDCATVCVDCNTDSAATCVAECERIQGSSDGFGWLDSKLDGWGCTSSRTEWSPVDCR